MAAEIALNDRTPAIHRSFSIRGKKPIGPCDSNASTSAFNNGRIPLPGFVILVAADAQHKITLYGTPADRAGLCVGDEIIEVNGTPVEGKEHAEIVRLIHKGFCCVQKVLLERALLMGPRCLTVRRKSNWSGASQSSIVAKFTWSR
ncbi:hypothetical protein Tcan_16014 [Toxocara canis]|uniref:PDZ domain-containing protein n=1 Tax=Toxocara canis TaxID=6265 RepID=A0A0B2VT20_TOXCA|nr:hypothetical protein Tcan_16014 [Toxocara canis]